MALIGAAVGSKAGNFIGGRGSEVIAKKIGIGKKGQAVFKDIGSKIGTYGGTILGSLIPFKNGGMVQGLKNSAVPIMAHGGEFVLPVGIKPTKKQKDMIQKRKKASKEGKKGSKGDIKGSHMYEMA